MSFVCPHVCSCLPLADVTSVFCKKVIWQVLRWFRCVVSNVISIPPHDVMRSSDFLRTFDDSLRSVLFYFSLVFFVVSPVYHGSARVLPFRFELLCRWPLVAFFMDVGTFQLAQSERVNLLVSCWLWVRRSVVGVTPFALQKFALSRLIFAIYNCFIAFDGVSSFAQLDFCVDRRFVRRPIDR